jgi:hypothetical protein
MSVHPNQQCNAFIFAIEVRMSSSRTLGSRLDINQFVFNLLPQKRFNRSAGHQIDPVAGQLLEFVCERDEVQANRGFDVSDDVNVTIRQVFAAHYGSKEA